MTEFTTWRSLVDGEEIAAIPDSGGSHQWSFDEGDGGTAADSIGSLDGSISGASWADDGDGVGDTYLEFDGTDDQVDLPSDAQSELSHWVNEGEGTFCIWIHPKNDGTRMCAVGGRITTSERTFALRRESSNSVESAAGNGDGARIFNLSGGDVTEGDGWTPVAVTADGSTAKLYVGLNADEVDSDTVADTRSGDLETDMKFGTRENEENYWEGNLDIPWFDSTAVSQSDIEGWIDDTKEFYGYE